VWAAEACTAARQRRVNLRLSILALLLGPAIGYFVVSLIQSPAVLSRLPYQPGFHLAVQWIASGVSIGLESLLPVMLIQVLVWWDWKPFERSNWPTGVGLILALTIGSMLQMYGHVLSRLVFSQGSIPYDWSVLAQSLISSVWVLCMFAVLWVALTAARPVLATRLVDLSSRDIDQQDVAGQRTWSIRGLMVATLVIAIVTAIYQAVIRYQQQTIDVFGANMGWISLAVAIGYCCTNLIVLWSAARYSLGGSWLLGYGALVIATTIQLGQNLATTHLIGPTYSVPLSLTAIIRAAILIATMFSMHLWLFSKWEQAGYELRKY
jgi:hypothetical protein